MVTICANTETLRPIWGDIYDAAGLTGSHDWDESIAQVWCKKFAELLDAAGIEWRYESEFEKWHGHFAGTYHCVGESQDQVFRCAELADHEACKCAQADIDSMKDITI